MGGTHAHAHDVGVLQGVRRMAFASQALMNVPLPL
jgi:hypothetical protein